SGTGVGGLRPELKVLLTDVRVVERVGLESRLFEQAAACVRPGGRLVYATCSVLPRENEDRMAAFQERHPRFRIQSSGTLWREAGAATSLPISGDFFRASPYVTETDGFFAGVFVLPEI